MDNTSSQYLSIYGAVPIATSVIFRLSGRQWPWFSGVQTCIIFYLFAHVCSTVYFTHHETLCSESERGNRAPFRGFKKEVRGWFRIGIRTASCRALHSRAVRNGIPEELRVEPTDVGDHPVRGLRYLLLLDNTDQTSSCR